MKLILTLGLLLIIGYVMGQLFEKAGLPKFIGSYAGARLLKAGSSIQKNTAGGLFPQGGIIIGLVLSI